jgi:hypothetical protein
VFIPTIESKFISSVRCQEAGRPGAVITVTPLITARLSRGDND